MALKSKTTTIIGFIVVAVLAAGCSDPVTPVPPAWDVDLNLPLATSTYTLQDLLNDDSVFTAENGLVVFRQTFPLARFVIGDSLTLRNTTFGFSKTLGLLAYDIPTLVEKDLTLATVFPSLKEGTYIVPPLENTQTTSITVDASQYFEQITFEDGKILIHLKNNFPVPITFPVPFVLTTLDGREISTTTVNAVIPPGATETLPPIYLEGITLTKGMKMAFRIATPGSNNLPVNITRSSSLNVSASITGTKISEAVASLPSQRVELKEKINITETSGLTIQKAVLKSGTIEIRVTNHVPIGATAALVINGLWENGKPVSKTISLPPRSQQRISIPIAGLVLEPLNGSELEYSLSVETEDASQRLVTLRSTDSISVKASVNNVALKSLTGRFDARSLEIKHTQNVDFQMNEKFQGSLNFKEARMWVDMMNGTAVPVLIESGVVRADNIRASRSASISIPRTYIPGERSSTIDFDTREVTDFLNTFSSSFPNRLSFEGSVRINPEGAMGTITDTDELAGDLTMEIPLQLSIKNGAFADTSALTFDRDSREKLRNVVRGFIHFEFENHFPAGVELQTSILDKSFSPVIIPNADNGSTLQIPAGVVDANGQVVSAATAVQEIELSREEFQRLADSGEFIRLLLKVSTPGNGMVQFRTDDYLKVRTYLTVRINTAIVSN
ncbi:MAG: hypothetical protein GXO82_08945 [Chlorobi bacterium]|nr:hypothetical protein [Chlorobiota bacterium]